MTEPVIVRRIELVDVMVHEHTDLALPERGVVLVTGANGSGKSSIIEGVAVALWGKTLRGTPPWVEGARASKVEVQLSSDLVVERTRHGKRIDLDFYRAGRKGDTRRLYETTTKAQEALEARIGSFDVWRRAHVLSSSDAAHFSLATDGERKRLLEAVLALDRFDDALELCRTDLKMAERAAIDADRQVDVTGATLEGAKGRRADAERVVAGLAVPVPELAPREATGSLPEVDVAISRAEAEVRAARERLRAADRAGAGQDAAARQCEADLHRLVGEACPTCAQPVPEALRVGLREGAERARGAAERAREGARAECAGLEAEIGDLESELAGLRGRRAEVSEKLAQARAVEAARRDHDRRAEDARGALAKALRTEADATKARDMAVLDKAAKMREAAVLRAVEAVLGLKGVRANILARALGGLEAVTNSWLARLGLSGLAAHLRPYSERKTGGVTDSISIEIVGAGGGHGYRAASGGERRRIDLALMLAIAEVAAAAQGREVGTLFFDELFDALDVEGVQAVSAALEELSRERCVVVITHSEILARALRPVRRVELADGLVLIDEDSRQAAQARDTIYRLGSS